MLRYLILLWAVTPLLGLAENTFYVSLSGSNIVPYNSLGTAATTIQAAVDEASIGDKVIISGGHYILSSAVTVDKSIEIIASGNAPVIVDGAGVSSCFILEDIDCTLNSLIISNGYSNSGNGGGVYCSGTQAVLTNCIIIDCEAEAGGGVYGTTAYFCVIKKNHASIYGGGAESAILYSCSIYNNTANDEGAGIDGTSAYNCLISSNTVLNTGFGGAGASYGGVLVNCTVVNNYSAGNGGGIDGSGIPIFVTNSIVVDNWAEGSGMNFYGAVDIVNSCCPDLTNGLGNISANPSFNDAANCDYRLSIFSPCIDAGDSAFAVSMVDLGMNSRIADSAVDMGAYEFRYSPHDLDKDGMDDPWEIGHFGSTNAMPLEMDDSDEFNNLQEFIAGTDPLDAASYFAISNSMASDVIIHWTSVSNREYSVFWTPSLTNSFQSLETGIEFPRETYTNSQLSPDGFYKVDVKLK